MKHECPLRAIEADNDRDKEHSHSPGRSVSFELNQVEEQEKVGWPCLDVLVELYRRYGRGESREELLAEARCAPSCA